VAQHVGCDRSDVVGRHVAAVVETGDRLRGCEEVHARARARSELDARQRARGPDDRRRIARHLVGDSGGVDLALRCQELSGLDDRLHVLERRRPDPAMPEPEDRPLRLLVGIAELELEQEAVELRLGQRVRPLVLDGVLRREDEERLGQRVRLALDRDLPLLHRLEQRGLRLRRRPVDLVGEEHAREDGPRPEQQLSAAQGHRPEQVGRQHVGRELGAPEVEPQRARNGVRNERLGDAGNALEQHVTPDEKGAEYPLHGLLVRDGDLADLPHDAFANGDHSAGS
jgi:hypothetical protein